MATDAKPTVEWDPHWTRAERLRNGPQSGHGWHIEWAESAFFTNAKGEPVRFQYVVMDGPCIPWAGLDDALVDKGYRTREELQTVRGFANEKAYPESSRLA